MCVEFLKQAKTHNPKPNLTAIVNNQDNQVATALPKPASRKAPRPAEKPKPDKIRVELNVEKWPAIWRPSSSKKAPVVRTLEREIELADGTRGLAKLEIGFTQLGTITTEDQKMFYALIRHWEENGKPADRPVYFSDRVISRLLKKRGWGSNVIAALTGSLRRLRTTPLRWIKSYHKKDNPEREYEEETFFNFLDTLKIVTRKEHGHVTNQQGYFQFDKEILANLLNHYTKPLLDEEFFKLRTEIGQLLYTHVDLVMADKFRYERCSKELFYDLGLLKDNPSYKFASNRKQALLRPVAELQGRRLSTGVLKSIGIERTKDGRDYKVVFQKGRAAVVRELDEVTVPEAKPDQHSAVVVNDYSKRHDPLVGKARELLLHFHKSFHGVDNHHAQTRETGQALALISQYGMERAKHLIDFAKSAVSASNYTPQTFGGILQYTSRALADFDRQRTAAPRPVPVAAAQTERQRHEKQQRDRGELRLSVLTEEQVQARFAQARVELLRDNPFMARQPEGSRIHEGAIRAWVIRQLAQEPMDLLVIDPKINWESLRRQWATQNLPL